MNMKRFLAKTSREALALVKQKFGDDAVVLSTKPASDGVEVLAMGPDSILHIEQMSATAPITVPAALAKAEDEPAADAERLAMSTLSFQDYVRERMLRRRQAALRSVEPALEVPRAAAPALSVAPQPQPQPQQPQPQQPQPQPRPAPAGRASASMPMPPSGLAAYGSTRSAAQAHIAQRCEGAEAPAEANSPLRPLPLSQGERGAAPPLPCGVTPALSPALSPREREPAPPVLRDPIHLAAPPLADTRRDIDVMHELRQMKALIEERFGALAFMDRLSRSPKQATLARTMLDAGFSPALIRKLVDGMGPDVEDELAWASAVLERNLSTNEHEGALEDQGGTYALIGATGVGKTTSTAKIAAAFATRHGAANLGLITLDAYRVAAHEQLRAYGRILGVPVHTAHDRATLEDLLELLAAKKMVLIDTAGIGQRDTRMRELQGMLAHRSIARLLVVSAAAQGETIEDVMQAYRASQCAGLIVSKMDEALRIGPALDAAIRHRLKVVGVANGQRVPEDWHRLSAKALVHRAVRPAASAAFRMEESEVRLMFAGSPRMGAVAA